MCVWQVLVLWFGLSFASTGQAVDPLLSLKIGEAETKLKVIETAMSNPEQSPAVELLGEFQEQGQFIRDIAETCIETNEGSISRSAQDLELLGEPVDTEDQLVKQKRNELNQSMLSNAQQLASCRLLMLRAQETADEVLRLRQQNLADRLLARRSTLFTNFRNVLLNPVQLFVGAVDFVVAESGVSALIANLPLVIGLLALAIGLIALTRKLLRHKIDEFAETSPSGYLEQVQVALAACVRRHAIALILSATLSLYYAYQLVSGTPLDFLGLLLFGLFLYVLANLVIRVLLNPCPPGQALTQLPEDIAQLLARRLALLTKLLLAGFLMYSAIRLHDFPDEITALLRNVYMFLLVLNLTWVAWLLRYYQGLSNTHGLRFLIILALLLCLGADWLGYSNLASFILVGISGSMLAWALAVFLMRLWSDFIDSLDEGRHGWERSLRKRLGVKEDEFLPGSIWFRFTFALVLWSAFAVAVLRIWGLPNTMLLQLRDLITDGFTIGAVQIVPVKLVLALLFFGMMLSVIGWIKGRMDKSWLKRSRMERGSKEAMISLTGYLAVAIALLVGLSIAGVELANLALIAGALSVGIGFGLQNIVNNFISGVILLFERPVKTGDWIVVGGTEGFVKKISIRSTQIQTFDRSDVIVPNSELISSQVTNWMFRDHIGRVVVPVGVAYGSDVEKVRSILLDIAYQHPLVISDSPVLPKPNVLFRTFGDSSLDFEIRCFIGEIDSRLSVISEMNFSIDKAFRDAGIEIPFPQRDVHMIEPKTDGEQGQERPANAL
jgi:small-conductance mechanosensitive channel